MRSVALLRTVVLPAYYLIVATRHLKLANAGAEIRQLLKKKAVAGIRQHACADWWRPASSYHYLVRMGNGCIRWCPCLGELKNDGVANGVHAVSCRHSATRIADSQ